MFKDLIVKKLEKSVVKYFEKHPDVKLVVVAGSVGKTSTKRALGHLLTQRFRVRMTEEGRETSFSTPLETLGINEPEKTNNPFVWLKIFRAIRLRTNQPTDVDVIVQELNADRPGNIAKYCAYLKPDIALITAVTPEHMEFFGTIEAVAQEEMSVANYAKLTLINRDDIEGRFAEYATNPNFLTYGTTGAAEYRFEQEDFDVEHGYKGNVIAVGNDPFPATIKVAGEHSIRPVMGAVAAAMQLGMSAADVAKGLATIRPIAGRMNILNGIDDTIIIDDSYNSSPAAAASALQAMYAFIDVPQRIVVLGDMRELGATSQVAHEELAMMCDPSLLSWVVTVGPEMEKYLIPLARQRGCQVHVAKNAIEAGKFVRSVTQRGAYILVKGSQDTIYLEECVKILCDMTEDKELVRQTPDWLATKDKYFAQFQ